MTSAAHRSGTERVHEISQSVAADVYLNIQGDEPMTRAEHIAGLIEVMQDPAVQVGTLMTRPLPPTSTIPARSKWSLIRPGALSISPARPFPTIATAPGQSISSISASMLIASRRWTASSRFLSPRSSAASAWSSCASSRTESRFTCAETPYDTVGVDTEEDLRRVEEILGSRC